MRKDNVFCGEIKFFLPPLLAESTLDCVAGGHGLVSAPHGAHRLTEATAVPIVRSDVARTEEEAACAARAVRAERGRPVVAAGPEVRGNIIIHISRGRKKNRVTVWSFYIVTFLVVERCPSPRAFACELLKLLYRRHTPITAPIGSGGIVCFFEFSLVVGEAVVTIV